MLLLVQSLRSKNFSEKNLSADFKRYLANMVINKEIKLVIFAALFNKSNTLHIFVDMGPDNTPTTSCIQESSITLHLLLVSLKTKPDLT